MPVSVDIILRMVAAEFQVSVLDLRSRRRDAHTAAARRAAYWLARQLTLHSLPTIGRLFGNRDHTTVLYGVSRMQALIDAGDPDSGRVVVLRRFAEGAWA